MIKAILFDCFGVVLTDALSEIVAKLQQRDPSKADRIVGLVAAGSNGRMDAVASRAAVAGELGMTLDEYVHTMRSGEVKNVALLEYARTLRRSYKTAMLSNIISGGLAARFPHNELAQYFDVVVASADIGFAKPEAEAYQITADRLGVRYDECVMIDDREDYCQGAIAAGMHAILYKSLVQLQRDLDRVLQH